MKTRTTHLILWCLVVAAVIVGITAWIETSTNRMVQHLAAGPCFSAGFALERYVEKYGKLPPYVVFGPNKEPYHSWRVLLLEFTATHLHREYDFTLPWHHDHNRGVALKFNPYSVAGSDPAYCQIFRVKVAEDNADLTRLGNRFLLIVKRDKKVSWTEPADVGPEEIDDNLLESEPFVYVCRKGQTRLRQDADPVLVREAFGRRLEVDVLRSLIFPTNKPLEGE